MGGHEGGRPAGRLVAGEGNHAYVLALHEELLEEPLGLETDLYAPWEASAWRWWSVRLGAQERGALVASAPVASGPVASAASRVLRAGGRELIGHASFETGATTLLVPQEDGGLASGLEVTGYPYGLIQFR